MTDNTAESLRPDPQRRPLSSEGTIYTKFTELQQKYAKTAGTLSAQFKQLIDLKPDADLEPERNEFDQLNTKLANLGLHFDKIQGQKPPFSFFTGMPSKPTYEEPPTIQLPTIPSPPPIPAIPIPEPLPLPLPPPPLSHQPEMVREEDPAIILARGKASLLVDSLTSLRSTNGITDTTYREKRTELLALSISPDIPHKIRKELAQKIGDLAKEGVDPEFTRHLGTIVRKIAKGKTEVPLPEQDMALRALFSIKNADAEATLVQLLTGEVHPQIKKYILHRLNEDRYKYTGFLNGLSYDFFNPLLRTDARQIDWDTLQPLTAISLMASKEIKQMATRIVPDIYRDLLHGNKPETISQIHHANPDIPWGALLQVYQLSQISNIPLERFNEVFKTAKKSSRITDELMYSMTALLDTDSNSDALTKSGAILKGLLKEPITTDNLSLFNSALRKAMVLSRVDGIEKNGRFSRVITNVFTADEHADYAPPFSLTLTNQKLTHEIADAFTELFPGKKFDRRKIEQLIDIWEDVDPIIIYAINLAKNTYDDDSKRALELLEDMVAHMDPPQLSEWKQWRYNLQDDTVKSQIGMLSEQARTAYMADYFIPGESLFVGENLADRPQEIRMKLAEIFGFDHDDVRPITPAIRILRSLYSEISPEDPGFIEPAQRMQAAINEQILLLSRLVDFHYNDLKTASIAEQRLESWRGIEKRRVEALSAIGYTTALTQADIDREIDLLQEAGLTPDVEYTIQRLNQRGILRAYEQARYRKSKGNDQTEQIMLLTNTLQEELGDNFEELLKASKKKRTLSDNAPRPLWEEIAKYLEKHGLDENATSEQLAVAHKATQDEYNELMQSDVYHKAKAAFNIPEQSSVSDHTGAMYEAMIARDVLGLSTLTPKQLAMNSILPVDRSGDRGASFTVNGALKVLQLRYKGNYAMLEELQQIEAMVNQTTIQPEQQDLAFVFTDNPMVGLTVGRFPAGAVSCQNYRAGASTLAAYPADALTKFCLVINTTKLPTGVLEELKAAQTNDERIRIFNTNTLKFLEAMVARRITKVVKHETTGQPELFLEPLYTPLDLKAMTKQLDRFASDILAPATGLQLVKGANRDNRSSTAHTVQVATSRNLYQYEDGATGGPFNGGLGTKKGSYNMPAIAFNLNN